jgi:integrase
MPPAPESARFTRPCQAPAANPAARSKRPKSSTAGSVQVWAVEQLGSFLATARSHRLFAFYRLAA